MKKITTVIITGIAALSLTACGNSYNSAVGGGSSAPGSVEPHPDCQEASQEMIDIVNQEFIEEDTALTNAYVIESDPNAIIGGSVVNERTGEVHSRSEIWHLDAVGALFSVSQGAIEYTGLYQSNQTTMVDAEADGVDRCVIAATEGMPEYENAG